MKVQRIEDATASAVNFDEFSVTIMKMPTRGPATPEALVEYVRTHLGDLTDPNYATWPPHYQQDSSLWQRPGPAAVGTLVYIEIPLRLRTNTTPIHEEAAVVTSRSSPTSWVFSPVTIGWWGPGEHPVSGNREFGFRPEEGSFGQIYTRGVDRAIDHRIPREDFVYAGGVGLWTSFQLHVKAYIEENGGEARINEPIIERPKWDSDEVRALLGKSEAQIYTELELRQTLKSREQRRAQVAAEELRQRPQVLKQRAWDYLVTAVGLACADPGYFSNKYEDEDLPGVILTQADFEQFSAADRSRVDSTPDIFGSRKRPALSACQIFLLDRIGQQARPVTVSWIAQAAVNYRKDHPGFLTRLAQLPGKLAEDIDQMFSELSEASSDGSSDNSGDGSSGRRASGYDTSGSTRGFSGGFNGSRPDFDMGPGSTLGR